MLSDPARPATPRSVLGSIERLGFVQIDTINRVERAHHHHILHSRLDDYQPIQLTRLLERDRSLFEHWTHDAGGHSRGLAPVLATSLRRLPEEPETRARWIRTKMGADHERVTRRVWRRITREGPLTSRDFEDAGTEKIGRVVGVEAVARGSGKCCGGVGKLSITGRRNFTKVYDRTDRVFPKLTATSKPSAAQHRDWACRIAMERMAVATPIRTRSTTRRGRSPNRAREWLQRAPCGEAKSSRPMSRVRTARLRERLLPRVDWEQRAAKLPRSARSHPAAESVRPAHPRSHPNVAALSASTTRSSASCRPPSAATATTCCRFLEADRFVGRLDPRFDRERGVLVVNRIWWEPDVQPTRARLRALDTALDLLARQLGASARSKSSDDPAGSAENAAGPQLVDRGDIETVFDQDFDGVFAQSWCRGDGSTRGVAEKSTTGRGARHGSGGRVFPFRPSSSFLDDLRVFVKRCDPIDRRVWDILRCQPP